MIRKLLLCFALALAFQMFTPTEAAAQCGGEGQVPCYDWSWCAYTTPSIFGDVCWGGLVARGSFGGCASNRFNNWGLFCTGCGGAGQPTCNYGSTCNTDQRYTPFGLCYPCGQSGQATCLSGDACDPGNRPIWGFCSYSGFSNEPTTNVATMPTLTQSSTDPVRGIADLHTHQFSNLGFGGVVFWGAPYDSRGINSALAWCDYTYDFSTEWSSTEVTGPQVPGLGFEIHGPKTLQALTHPLSNAFPEGQHEVGGTGPFDGWPTYNTTTHQQMYYKWLERAYLGGVRLINQLMVSNEALCGAGKRRSNFTCNDMEAVDKEIQATKDLERAVNRMDDGVYNNSGWYRIAYSPAQARQIIRAGKLAVVLGIEVDSLFDCKRDTTTCTREYIRGKLQAYYNLGVRHVFPIHQFDNAFGGAALFRDELNAGNVTVTNSHFSVRDCSGDNVAPDKYNYNIDPTDLDFLTWLVNGKSLPDQKTYDKSLADCNSRGLTAAGTILIEEMMDLKFIIDTDHMSRLMVDAVLDMAKTTSDDRPNKYPLVSSHSGFVHNQAEKSEFSVTNAQLAIFKDIGGMVTATIPHGGCATGYKDGYLFAVKAMQKDATDKFAGVAFSTDVNGFAGNLAPCATGLTYPFTGIMGGSFNQQVTGSKTFNFNNDGGAHYGLYADFFASLKAGSAPLTDAELDPLLNSAESYIRLWERVNTSDQTPPPTITALVNGTEGTNGWYTSDVTITWEVEASEFATSVTKVGCDDRTISSDTGGTVITCRATNDSGEASQSSVVIRRDATPPTFTATRTTPTPASGWTNQDVFVSFTAADARSGIGGSSTAAVQITREGKDLVASWVFYDRAGNTVEATLGGINIDKTRPRIGFGFAHLPPRKPPYTAEELQAEQQKWHNHPVTLIVDAQDDLSGIASITPAELVFATEGTNLKKFATVVDRAGNSVSDDNDPIKIDLTPPTIQLFTRLPAANPAGWNKETVNVTWRCKDTLSGTVAESVSSSVATEGDAQTATQECKDNAGNTTSNTVGNIRIDLTAPTLTYQSEQPPANANGWNRTNVGLPFIPADALSGVASTSIPSPLMLTTEGAAVTGAVSVTDVAGNSASFTSPPVKIDKTAPAITFVSRLPEANENGWNNSDITVQWTCADELSGVVAGSLSHTLSAEGANQSLTGTCADIADNTTADTRGALSLDKTAPVVQCVADPAVLFPPNQQLRPVTVALTFTDALAGPWTYLTTNVASNESGVADDVVGFAIGSTSLSGSMRAQRNGNGSGRFYTLGYEGRDRAGNTADCSTKVIVPHDGTQQAQQQ